MDWINRNPEKVALIAVALVAIGFGVKQILGARAFPEQFVVGRTAQKDQFPEIEINKVRLSREIVSTNFTWPVHEVSLPGGAEKVVPLLRSVVIIEKDGRLFDMQNPNEDPLRPPVENWWLLEHQLDFLSSGVLENDPDGDGYSNLEEWNGKTIPVERDSHPPYTDKLRFVERKSRGYMLRFAANNPGQNFQVNTRDFRGRRETHFVTVGDNFPKNSGRFTILKYDEKEGLNRAGIRTDVSELTVKDNNTDKTFVIVKDIDKSWPTYFAQFDFTLDPSQREFFVREGDTFTLNLAPGVEYRLLEVTEQQARIQKTGSDEEIVIPKGSAAAAPSEDDFF